MPATTSTPATLAFGLTRSRHVVRPEHLRAGQFVLCPHCGRSLLKLGAGQGFGHPAQAPCPGDFSMLARAAAEVLAPEAGCISVSAVERGLRLQAPGGTALAVVFEGAQAGAVLADVAQWPGQGEHLATNLSWLLREFERRAAPKPAVRPAPLAAPAAAPSVAAPAAPVAPALPRVAEAAQPAPTTAAIPRVLGGQGRPEPVVQVPQHFPPLLKKNLEMRKLQWEWLPGWLTEPVPTARGFAKMSGDWQMVLSILFLEKGWPGKAFDAAWAVKFLVDDRQLVAEKDRAALPAALTEFMERLVQQGFAVRGDGGGYKRSKTAFGWDHYRPQP